MRNLLFFKNFLNRFCHSYYDYKKLLAINIYAVIFIKTMILILLLIVITLFFIDYSYNPNISISLIANTTVINLSLHFLLL